jgi:FtsH-binding integral membrane protein
MTMDLPLTKSLPMIEHNIKNRFIQKIYMLLSCQLAITMTMSMIFYYDSTLTQFALSNTGMVIVSFLCTLLFLFLAFCYGRVYPYNYLILLGFTLGESYSITYLCLFYQAPSIFLAWGMTLGVFLSLSIYVHWTQKDFNFLGAGLFAGLMVIIIGGLIQVFWLPNDQILSTTMAILGSFIACGYILYDTSEMIHRLEPDDFVHACMNLYLDIIMLFVRLLELFGEER